MTAFLEITLPNRITRRHPVKESDLSIGRSPGCNIPLPEARRLQPEHLLVKLREEGLLFSLADARSAPLLFHGQSLITCLVPWEEEVYAAGIRFKPERGKSGDTKKTAALAAVPVAAALLFAGASYSPPVGENGPSPPAEGVTAPMPWESEIPCSRPDPGSGRAREAEAAARAKMQRYRFAARDGVQAINLLREARQCHLAEGSESEAARIGKLVDAWRARLDRDHESHRLRLRLAMQKGDRKEALREVRALRALLEPGKGATLSWLEKMERRLSSGEEAF
jgi:hypothetical protein